MIVDREEAKTGGLAFFNTNAGLTGGQGIRQSTIPRHHCAPIFAPERSAKDSYEHDRSTVPDFKRPREDSEGRKTMPY